MTTVLLQDELNFLVSFNFKLLFWSWLLSIVLHFFAKYTNFQNIIKNFSISTLIKFILIASLLITFMIFVYVYYVHYCYIIRGSPILKDAAKVDSKLYDLSAQSLVLNSYLVVDAIGLIFILIAYFVGFLSFMALDTRLYSKNNRFIFICYALVLAVIVFFCCRNIIVFFLSYEMLLIPSFFFVYYVATSKRGTQAAIYFLIWTQIGSFFVLLVVIYIVCVLGVSDFTNFKELTLTKSEVFSLYFFLFIGFGIKVPIWPAHYWITKTHVEAPAGFSMFLSGFLVKTALFGFCKITNLLGMEIGNIFLFTLCVIGIIDASIKMWCQTDLKKLVAYSTIQEMNLIFMAFCWGDAVVFFGGLLFCITHSLLSPLFFFLVDCVQRRHNSRSILEVNGICHIYPNLGAAILMSLILYSGLPGTLKFTSEFFIFIGLVETGPITLVIIVYGANFLGLLGVLKAWYNVLFGLNIKNQKKIGVDLTFKEFLIIYSNILILILFQLFINVIF